jgi:small subunit ribosomal protein S3
MGQKVNPHGLRVGVIKDWDSKWYADAEFSDYLVEDYNIRKFLKKKLYSAGVSKIEIERASDRVKVIIYTAKPGVVIGKGGAEIEVTKKELSKLTDKKVMVDIKEIKRPDRDAQLVAENIAQQLENRVSFRRAMKSCMGRTMKSGAMGIKTCCSGRLGGADIARAEFYSEGTIPLQTLRADIDYAQTTGTAGLDTHSTGLHGSAHAGLHCTSEGYTVLQLLSNVLSYQLCISVRSLDLFDVNHNLLIG